MDQNSGSKCVGQVEKKAVDYFCHTWTINNFDNYWENTKENFRIKSPEFTTGANNENTWYLQLISMDLQNRRFSSENFLYGNVFVHLKSSAKPLTNVELKLSIIKRDGENTTKEKKILKSINSGNHPVCEFSNVIS